MIMWLVLMHYLIVVLKTIIRADAIKHLQYSSLGTVTLKAFDGRRSQGVLISLNVKLATAGESIPVRFVMCDYVSHPCLLSLSDYRHLLEQGRDAEIRHDDNCVYGHDDNDADINDANIVTNDDDVVDDGVTDDICGDGDLLNAENDSDIIVPIPQNLSDPVLSSGDKLADEQRNDKSTSSMCSPLVLVCEKGKAWCDHLVHLDSYLSTMQREGIG